MDWLDVRWVSVGCRDVVETLVMTQVGCWWGVGV